MSDLPSLMTPAFVNKVWLVLAGIEYALYRRPWMICWHILLIRHQKKRENGRKGDLLPGLYPQIRRTSLVGNTDLTRTTAMTTRLIAIIRKVKIWNLWSRWKRTFLKPSTTKTTVWWGNPRNIMAMFLKSCKMGQACGRAAAVGHNQAVWSDIHFQSYPTLRYQVTQM